VASPCSSHTVSNATVIVFEVLRYCTGIHFRTTRITTIKIAGSKTEPVNSGTETRIGNSCTTLWVGRSFTGRGQRSVQLCNTGRMNPALEEPRGMTYNLRSMTPLLAAHASHVASPLSTTAPSKGSYTNNQLDMKGK
jgi:hypothetical protein